MLHIPLLKFLLLALLLAFSAFFSAAETALFSLDSIKLRRIAQAGKSTSLILKLLENPMRCLTTILFGNTVV
ncbi:MAG: CNNM domain-containing protein, partial [Candidatus Omnitrophota bacterium]